MPLSVHGLVMPALLLGLALLTPSSQTPSRALPSSPPDQRYALLVGISDYPGEDEDLGNGPLNDLMLMERMLVSRYGFDPAHITVLRDSEASRTRIIDAFLKDLGRAGKSGVAVFYFSGHGTQIPNVGEDIEADGLDEVIVTRGEGPDDVSYLLDEELGLLSSLIGTERTLVILDNCYSGTGTRGVGGQRDTLSNWVPLELRAAMLGDPRGEIGPRLEGKRLRDGAFTTALSSRPLLLSPDSNGFVRPAAEVLLSASAESELSLNTPIPLEDGRVIRAGLFTLALVAELNDSTAADKRLEQIIAAIRPATRRVAAALQAGPQTPQAEGPGRHLRVADYLSLE